LEKKMPQLDLSPEGLSASRTVVQTGHGLAEFDFVYVNGDAEYVKALADAVETAEVVGWVQKTHGADKLTVCHMGMIKGLTALTPGQCYFLSDADAGEFVVDAPVDEGSVSKPLFIALSATEAIFVNQRGQLL
jgi:hypothetical protein